jgi:hypothetical protein
MRPTWKVSGEAAKAWDVTKQRLDRAGVFAQPIKWKSKGADEFEFTVQRGHTPPEHGQKISVWRNEERVFHGDVILRKVRYIGGQKPIYDIQVAGPWYWLATTQLTGLVADSTGATKERITYQLAPGNLRDMLIALVNRANAIGLPIKIGTVDTMFNVGRQTFSNTTFAAAITKLLEMVPDAAPRIDYSQSPPALCIERRGGTMPETTLEYGSNDLGRVELAPMHRLRPTGIRVATASRAANGKIVFGEQVAGTATGARIVTASGPELLPFEVPDNLPSVAIRTDPIDGDWSEAAALDSVIANAIATYGTIAGSPYSGTWSFWTFLPAKLTDATTGAAVAFGSRYRLISGQLMDFLKKDYGLVESTLKFQGTFRVTASSAQGDGTTIGALREAGRCIGGFTSTGVYHYQIYSEFTVQAINLNYPTLTTLYEKAAYEYLTPVAGLATNLFNAANFTPYQGSAAINRGRAWQRWLATKLNITGAEPEWQTAGAIVSGVTVDMASDQILLTCGSNVPATINPNNATYTKAGGQDAVVKI